MSAPKQKPAEPPAAAMLNIGPPECEAGGILTVDLAAIAANWRLLARKVAPAECAAVVKADAYGCGLDPVTRTLVQAGCRTFFVALVQEARRVRLLSPDAAIYVLNGIVPGSSQAFADLNVRPVIGSMPELTEWEGFVAASGWHGGAALHVDTGMNRLGLAMRDAGELARRDALGRVPFKLLLSHFACSEQQAHRLNDVQTKRFCELRRLFPGVAASLANSSGIFLSSEAHGDLVRPGVALYGGNPTPGQRNPMRPVVELQACILQVRQVAAGDQVGYGATWTAPRDSRVAIIGAGYADGYFRAANMGGREVVVAGRRCPLVGRVSMDLFAVDVSDIPGSEVARGTYATLIGNGLDIDEAAAQAGTISYEMLTSLGRRYARQYRSE